MGRSVTSAICTGKGRTMNSGTGSEAMTNAAVASPMVTEPPACPYTLPQNRQNRPEPNPVATAASTIIATPAVSLMFANGRAEVPRTDRMAGAARP